MTYPVCVCIVLFEPSEMEIESAVNQVYNHKNTVGIYGIGKKIPIVVCSQQVGEYMAKRAVEKFIKRIDTKGESASNVINI